MLGAAGALKAGTRLLLADQAEGVVSVFHGSINGGAVIASEGFDVTRLGVNVSRDIAAAQDAINPLVRTAEDVTAGIIVESRIPSSLFNSMLSAERPYNGFFPNNIKSTEILLDTVEAIQLFNRFLVK